MMHKKGQVLVRPEDHNPYLYFLHKGIVSVVFTRQDGQERLIGYFIPGMTFAQSGMFFEDEGGGIEYIAKAPLTTYRIHRDEFFKAVKSDSLFNDEYMKLLMRNQIYLIERIVYQGENGIRRKILRWLLFMTKFYGTETQSGCLINIPLTQDEIANFLHATRESIGPHLRQLVKTDTIQIENKKITILKQDAIKSELELM